MNEPFFLIYYVVLLVFFLLLFSALFFFTWFHTGIIKDSSCIDCNVCLAQISLLTKVMFWGMFFLSWTRFFFLFFGSQWIGTESWFLSYFYNFIPQSGAGLSLSCCLFCPSTGNFICPSVHVSDKTMPNNNTTITFWDFRRIRKRILIFPSSCTLRGYGGQHSVFLLLSTNPMKRPKNQQRGSVV